MIRSHITLCVMVFVNSWPPSAYTCMYICDVCISVCPVPWLPMNAKANARCCRISQSPNVVNPWWRGATLLRCHQHTDASRRRTANIIHFGCETMNGNVAPGNCTFFLHPNESVFVEDTSNINHFSYSPSQTVLSIKDKWKYL